MKVQDLLTRSDHQIQQHSYPRRHSPRDSKLSKRALAAEPHGTCRSIDSEDIDKKEVFWGRAVMAPKVTWSGENLSQMSRRCLVDTNMWIDDHHDGYGSDIERAAFC